MEYITLYLIRVECKLKLYTDKLVLFELYI